MNLQEKRKQWELGGEEILVVTINDTVYVVLEFAKEYALHRYFAISWASPLNGKKTWEVSTDITNSTIKRCLEIVSEVFETEYPKN